MRNPPPPDDGLNMMAAHVVRRYADLLVRESWEMDGPLVRLADQRLHAGRQEKDGAVDDWAGWDTARFRREIHEELADAFVYVREALRRGMRL